ncbi:hypothetical protein D3C78_1687450 [compost metagenome]
MHFQQLPQRHVQRLLAHAEGGEQLLHAEARITGDEEQDAVVHPAQAAAAEHLVGFRGECPVAEEEVFHGLQLNGRPH